VLAAWGLNLQYGVTGVLNFGYIANLALGAYFYGILTLGPSSGNGGFQSYIVGLRLPAALAVVITIGVGCLFGGLVGMIGMKRLRPDYQAIVLLVVSIVALTIVEADSGLFNGNAGLALLPNPVGGTGPTTPDGWQYVALVFAVCIVGWLILRRFSDGPLGRSLRAVRDDDRAALAIGKNVVGLRILVQVVGGGFAALSGALLAAFIGAWAPSAWQFAETLSLLTAIIVGGVASNAGVVAGALLVPVIFEQATQYVPGLSTRPQLADDVGWMVTAVLTIIFIWWRPRGIVPDRRPRYGPGARRWSRFTLAPLGPAVQPDAARATVSDGTAMAEVPEPPPGGSGPPADGGPPAGGGGAAMPPTPAAGNDQDAPRGPAGVARAGQAGQAPLAADASPAAQPRPGAQPPPATFALQSRAAPVRGKPGRRPGPPAGSPLLVTSELMVHYGGVAALDGVGFAAAAGAVTGLIGPNGAGKSTYVNVVSGFTRSESGRVEFNGTDITRLSPHRRARLGLVRTFQLSRQFGRMSAIENLLVASAGHPAETMVGILAGLPYWRSAEEACVLRARELMATFEMTDKVDEPAGNLSGGERRMLELMRALMTDPIMLVLDEPLAGLSPRWSRRFEDAIGILRQQGITFLLIEHELGIIERLCETVVVMARGQVLSTGTMTELRTQREVQAAYVVG
jgi:ABC-type branched-subunit amino acid transport system ATPase component/ABC-type branched-subunit amino acid transport system permease subunit